MTCHTSGCSDAARTRTSTSPLRGAGTSMSRSSRTCSAGPYARCTIAFIDLVLSKLEVEAGFRKAPVLALVESVQACGAVRDVAFHLVGLDEEVHCEHALAEVALVESALEHELVEVLQLRERELFRQQLEADRLIAQLAAQARERRLQNVGVIEGKARSVVDAEPRRSASVCRCVDVMVAQVDE